MGGSEKAALALRVHGAQDDIAPTESLSVGNAGRGRVDGIADGKLQRCKSDVVTAVHRLGACAAKAVGKRYSVAGAGAKPV